MPKLASFMLVLLAAGPLAISASSCDDEGGSKVTMPDAAPDLAADLAPDLGFGGKFTTNVPPARTLDMLTPQEATKVCEATSEYVGRELQDPAVADLGCRVTSLFAILDVPDAEIKTACQEAYDACKAVPVPDADALPNDQCGEPNETTCTATVAEYEACVSELPATLMLLSTVLPKNCNTATKTSLFILAAGKNLLGAGCQAVDMKCPGTFVGLSDLPMLSGGLGQ